MGTRRRARECGLQLLYQLEAHVQSARGRDRGPGGLDGATESIDRLLGAFFENFDAPDKVRRYAEELARGVAEHHPEIDGLITRHSPNWRLERMAMVDRNVLRIAVYELLKQPDIPTSVIVDEAIEVARRFGSEKSSAFVHGVVDAIAKVARP